MRNNKLFRLAVILFGCIGIFLIILQDTGLLSKISERLTVWYAPAQNVPELGHHTCVDGVTLDSFKSKYPEFVKELKTNHSTQSDCIRYIRQHWESPTTEEILPTNAPVKLSFAAPVNKQPRCKGKAIGILLCIGLYISGYPEPVEPAVTELNISLPNRPRSRYSYDDLVSLPRREKLAMQYYEKSLEYHRLEQIDTGDDVFSKYRRNRYKRPKFRLVETPITRQEKKPLSVFCVDDMLSRSQVLTPLCYLPGVSTAP